MKIPLHTIVLRPNIPAGMDWSVIGHFVSIFRKYSKPCDPPVLVSPMENGLWRLVDGKHRFFASVIAGRTEIEAEIDPNYDGT